MRTSKPEPLPSSGTATKLSIAAAVLGWLFLAPMASAVECAVAQADLVMRIAGNAPNHCPAANAGLDLPVLINETATLDATGSSDADGDRITFAWSLISAPDGSSVEIADPSAMRTTFEPDQIGDYVFQVEVTDARGSVMTDTVRYSTANTLPVAHAGDDLRANVGEWVALSSQRSFDMDNEVLKFQWRLIDAPAGSRASLDSALPVADLFIDAAGDYTAELIVSDGIASSVADTVRISTINSIPRSHAGSSRRYAPGSTVQLSGALSTDVDGDDLSYSWSLLSAPANSKALLGDGAQISPTIYLEEAGLYLFQLVVDDGQLASASDTVVIELVAERLEDVNPKDYRHMISRGGGDDTDADGVLDLDDNCVLVANPAQRDTDGDGLGNFCDADLNNDGIVNAIDLGLFKSVFFTNDPDADFDGNGIVNTIDLGRLKLSFFKPPGPAGLIIWVSLVDGDWANRLNWAPQTVPTAGSAALINVVPDVTVTSTSDTATFKSLVNEKTLVLSSSTFEATGSIENGGVINTTSSTLNNTLIEPSLSGSGTLSVLSGSNTWTNVTLNIDGSIENGALVNSNDGLSVNSTVTINAPSSPTGFQFLNSQTLTGAGTIELNGAGNGVIAEPRVLPANSTVLTIDPGVTIRGGKGTIGNAFATIVMNGTVNADVSGETLRLTGAGISGAASLNASNGGAIEISGNYDNIAGTPVAVDTATGSISLLGGSALRHLAFNGTAGTNLEMPSGSVTLQDIIVNANITVANGALVNSLDGLTLNGVATVNAPSSPTGFQFLNSQLLDGSGTFVFNGSGNGVVAEPRLFPANSTTLTVGPNIVVRGGTATIGQAFSTLDFGGTLIADVAGEELVVGGASWSANQSIQAINSGEVRIFGSLDNASAALAVDTAAGSLSATSGATFTDVTLNGTAGTELAMPAGTYTLTNVIANLDMALANGALVNVTNGMTFNGTASITAPSSPTGFQFLNSQTLTGAGTFVFDATGNGVISEPRLFPANSTILTIDSGIVVRGGNATIGNAFATMDFGGTLISEKSGEEFAIGAALWNVDQSLQATGGGEIRLFGTLDNGGNPFALDAPGMVTSLSANTILRSVTVNGTSGTEIQFRAGTTTLDGVTINADTRHVNAAISNVANGLTLNGTATIVAPSSPTGLTFTNSQSLLGTATIVLDSAGNSVISEPRLFQANSTALTIGPGIAIEGATGTVGNAFATLIVNGSINANVSGEPIMVTGAWSGTGSVSATNGGEIRLAGTLDNAGATFNVDTAGGSLNVLANSTLR